MCVHMGVFVCIMCDVCVHVRVVWDAGYVFDGRYVCMRVCMYVSLDVCETCMLCCYGRSQLFVLVCARVCMLRVAHVMYVLYVFMYVRSVCYACVYVCLYAMRA